MARYIYENRITDDNTGKVLSGISVQVYLASTTTPATIYSSSSGGSAIAGGLVTTDSTGTYLFYVDDADYTGNQLFDIAIAGGGYSPKTYPNVDIFKVNHTDIITKNGPWVDVRAYADMATAVTAIGSLQTTLLIANTQTVAADLTIPANIALKFMRGGVITINSGKTLYINGSVEAGNFVIFTGAGTVNMMQGDRIYNIAWFDGASLDAKWDFARRGLVTNQAYIGIIPIPEANDSAATYYTTGYSPQGWRWKIAAPLYFDDPENFSDWYIYGQMTATAAMTAMMIFSPTNKTEDIRFHTRVDIDAANLATYGVEILGGARIYFNDELMIHSVTKGVYAPASTVALGEIVIDKLYCAIFSDCILDIRQNTQVVTGFKVNNIDASNASSASAVGVRLNGDVRNIVLPYIYYITDTGSDLAAAVQLEATASGRPQLGVDIGYIKCQNVTIGIKSVDLSGGTASKISDIKMGPVYPGVGKTAIDLDWISNSQVRECAYDAAIVLETNAIGVSVDSPSGNAAVFTDNGSYNLINGRGKQAAGAGNPPSTGSFRIGAIVVNTSDSTVWLKWQHTGTSSSDFIKIA